MSGKVSVIIPVYKVEPFIQKCVDSVIKQTYKNLEIILVDDGSPDNCPAICDKYAGKDPRVKVVHKQNGGLSDARNFGIEASTGEYLTFIDSDDYVSKDFIEALINGLESCGADICATGFKKVFEDSPEETPQQDFEVKSFSGKDALKTFYKLNEMESRVPFDIIACAKLYKRKTFDTLRFPVGRLHEDEYLTPKLYYSAEVCAHVSGQRYFYLQREGSITQKKNKKNYIDICDMLAGRVRFFEEMNEPEFLRIALNRLIGQSLWCYLEFYKDKEMVGVVDGHIKNYFIKQNYKFFRKKILRAGKVYKFSKFLYRTAAKIWR